MGLDPTPPEGSVDLAAQSVVLTGQHQALVRQVGDFHSGTLARWGTRSDKTQLSGDEWIEPQAGNAGFVLADDDTNTGIAVDELLWQAGRRGTGPPSPNV